MQTNDLMKRANDKSIQEILAANRDKLQEIYQQVRRKAIAASKGE